MTRQKSGLLRQAVEVESIDAGSYVPSAFRGSLRSLALVALSRVLAADTPRYLVRWSILALLPGKEPRTAYIRQAAAIVPHTSH